MSQRVKVNITCKYCNNQYDFTLYRSIWGEYPENRELVMSDNINVVTCQYCGKTTKLSYPFIYTNAKQFFAVWWEPFYDSQIDKESVGFAKLLGDGNYLANAPLIKDWDEFKQTIIHFEKEDHKITPLIIGNNIRNKKNDFLKEKKGCLSFIALLTISTIICGYKIFCLFG